MKNKGLPKKHNSIPIKKDYNIHKGKQIGKTELVSVEFLDNKSKI